MVSGFALYWLHMERWKHCNFESQSRKQKNRYTGSENKAAGATQSYKTLISKMMNEEDKVIDASADLW